MEASEVQPQSVSNVLALETSAEQFPEVVWSLATLRIVHRPLLQVPKIHLEFIFYEMKRYEVEN